MATSIYTKRPEDEVILNKIGEEIIAYDKSSGEVHLLPASIAKVYDGADGSSLTELSKIAFPSENEDVAMALLEGALDTLVRQNLLVAHSPNRLSRRAFAQKAAAVALLPAVLSVAVPSPAAAASLPCDVEQEYLASSPGVIVPACAMSISYEISGAGGGGGGGGGGTTGMNGTVGLSGNLNSGAGAAAMSMATLDIVVGQGGMGGGPGLDPGAGGTGGAGGDGGAGNLPGVMGNPGVTEAINGGGGGGGGGGGASRFSGPGVTGIFVGGGGMGGTGGMGQSGAGMNGGAGGGGMAGGNPGQGVANAGTSTGGAIGTGPGGTGGDGDPGSVYLTFVST